MEHKITKSAHLHKFMREVMGSKREHHAEGGMAGEHLFGGGLSNVPPHFKHGGRPHNRRCHRAEGGLTDNAYGGGATLKKGGSARCYRRHHAMGGVGKLRKGMM